MAATATRRGISAAEKYAELEAAGEERPTCGCHGVPMKWQIAADGRPSGGGWRCADAGRTRERTRAFRERNPDYHARWQRANRDRCRDYERRYLSENADAYARRLDRNRRRRALLADVEAEPILTDVLAFIEAAPCWYCGAPGGTVDHFSPIVHGGVHAARNLLPACRSCNSSKRDRDPIAFLIDKRAEIEEAL